MKSDLHTHTTFSDGLLMPDQLVEKAIEMGLDAIGITDHWGTKKYSDKFQVTDIGLYCETIKELQKKYPQIYILKGLEIDFSIEYGSDISTFPLEEFKKLDYILFEYADSNKYLDDLVDGRTLEDIIKIRDKFDIPIGLAHNHFMKHYGDRIDDVLKLMHDNDIFLELCEAEDNGNVTVNNRTLMQLIEIKKNMKTSQDVSKIKDQAAYSKRKHSVDGKYYFELFSESLWEKIVEYDVKISSSSDTHKGSGVGKNTLDNSRVTQLKKIYGFRDDQVVLDCLIRR